jgi:hypothetical protein
MKTKFTAEKLNAAAWASALASPITDEKITPGWFTRRELGQQLGKSETRMGELLRSAISKGRCERKKFRIAVDGVMRTIPHYRLKK